MRPGPGARPDLIVVSAWSQYGSDVAERSRRRARQPVRRLGQSSPPATGLGHVRTACVAGATGARLISLVTTSR
jgi:hypothetical protein